MMPKCGSTVWAGEPREDDLLKRVFLYSIVACAMVSGVSFVIGGRFLTLQVNAWTGIVLILIAAVMSGSLVSGDRMRANYHTSTPQDRKERNKWTGVFFAAGVPFLLVSILLYSIGTGS
jgi:hypothetical protein